jgi:hypothetical protein
MHKLLSDGDAMLVLAVVMFCAAFLLGDGLDRTGKGDK